MLVDLKMVLLWLFWSMVNKDVDRLSVESFSDGGRTFSKVMMSPRETVLMKQDQIVNI